jgi:hypothetical protein
MGAGRGFIVKGDMLPNQWALFPRKTGPGAIDTRIGRMRSFSRLAKRCEHEGPAAGREQHASS